MPMTQFGIFKTSRASISGLAYPARIETRLTIVLPCQLQQGESVFVGGNATVERSLRGDFCHT